MFKRRHTRETIEKIRQSKLKNPTRYWIGKKRSKETIEKIVATRKRKGIPAWNKGILNPTIKGDNNPARRIEIRKVLSEQKMGNKNPNYGKSAWNKGKKTGLIPKNGFTRGQTSGEKNFNWKGGITPIVMKIRNSSQTRKWRLLVFGRDNWTCQICRGKGGKLHADHIIPFSFILEQLPNKNLYQEAMEYTPLWNINIGRTLCVKCHETTDTYLVGARLITKEQKNHWKAFLERITSV